MKDFYLNFCAVVFLFLGIYGFNLSIFTDSMIYASTVLGIFVILGSIPIFFKIGRNIVKMKLSRFVFVKKFKKSKKKFKK